MAATTPGELQALNAHPNDVAKSFKMSADLEDFKYRVGIIETANNIAQAMMDPSDMGYHRCFNASSTVDYVAKNMHDLNLACR